MAGGIIRIGRFQLSVSKNKTYWISKLPYHEVCASFQNKEDAINFMKERNKEN